MSIIHINHTINCFINDDEEEEEEEEKVLRLQFVEQFVNLVKPVLPFKLKTTNLYNFLTILIGQNEIMIHVEL